MNRHALVLASVAALLICSNCGTAETRPSADQVLRELSRRSAMPQGKLEPLLANCDADQQSMYFCAYRDVVAADLALELAVAKKVRESPACRSSIDTMIANFERSRERACANAAADFDGGSMEPTAQAICVAAATNSIIHQVQKSDCR